jgi:hypothetical protein
LIFLLKAGTFVVVVSHGSLAIEVLVSQSSKAPPHYFPTPVTFDMGNSKRQPNPPIGILLRMSLPE